MSRRDHTERVRLSDRNSALRTPDMGADEAEGLPPLDAPAWQYLYKPLSWGGDKTAVLLMNHDKAAANLTVAFGDIPGVTCSSCHVRDLWARKDLGAFDGSFTASGVATHDCAFLLVTPA